jgi:ABC-type multidrug transport system fused ATPase/permease subunit
VTDTARNVDIAQVPLHVLRSKLSYIPQESLLTSGTLRDALDITGEKDDHELYAAMKQVHLDISPTSPFSSLDTLVSAGESSLLSNYSEGKELTTPPRPSPSTGYVC